MKVQLHIENLVLEGFDPRDRRRLRDAVTQELTRLIQQGNAVPRGLARDLHVPERKIDFAMVGKATPEGTGTQVARAVHQAIGTAGTPPVRRKGRARA